MSPRLTAVVFAFALTATAAGCSGGTSHSGSSVTTTATRSSNPPPAVSRGLAWQRLLAQTPEAVATVCRNEQTTHSFRVLCPGQMFVPPAGIRPPLHAFPSPQDLTGRGAFYEIDYSYGSPSNEVGPPSNPHPAQRHTPIRFLHLVIGGGTFHLDRIAIHQVNGGFPTSRPLGRRTIAGHRGTLWLGAAYPLGGYLGGHLTFVWEDLGQRYFASIHTWTPRSQAVTALTEIVASLNAG
jgi:hypothetical protein